MASDILLQLFEHSRLLSPAAMSSEAAQLPITPSSSDGVAAAEDAVRALWSALNRLDHSLTYLLPENCEDALNG